MNSDFYEKFENQFRGSREEIIIRLRRYDCLIETLFKNRQDIKVVDIGSGRGEWLQLCKEKGFESVGIDQDENLIALCKQRGLNTIQGDALKTLEGFETNSIDLISAFHVIEHINNETLFALFKECKRILKDNGFLILETPSIDNISVGTNSFYLDPTHINPIHPASISFILTHIGFPKVQYEFINGDDKDIENNFLILRLINEVAKDLLILASNDSQCNVFIEDSIWREKLKLSPTTFQLSSEIDETMMINQLKMNEMSLKLDSLIEQYNLNFNRIEKLFNNRLVKILLLIRKTFKNRSYIFSRIKRKTFRLINLLSLSILKSLSSILPNSFKSLLRKLIRIIRLDIILRSFKEKILYKNYDYDDYSYDDLFSINSRLLKRFRSSIKSKIIYKSLISSHNKFQS